MFMNKVICQIQKNEKNQAYFAESKHIVSALVIDENENIIFIHFLESQGQTSERFHILSQIHQIW